MGAAELHHDPLPPVGVTVIGWDASGIFCSRVMRGQPRGGTPYAPARRHNGRMESLVEGARAIGPALIDLRRELHRVPELDRELPKTQALVLAALEGLELEVTTGEQLSSVTAVLRGGAHDGSGPVVLLRGDMDALPLTEETGLDYASEHDGRMHACGHDLHVASLVGAARLLHERRAAQAVLMVFMWQPAEETTAGAPGDAGTRGSSTWPGARWMRRTACT